MLPAAARLMRFYPMDDPELPLEVLLAGFDALYAPVSVNAEGEEILRARPSLLSELTFAQSAAWLRALWSPGEVQRIEWWQAFGSDFAWWT